MDIPVLCSCAGGFSQSGSASARVLAPSGGARQGSAMAADWQSGLERARLHAPFLARGLERQPELAELLAAGRGDDALAWARGTHALQA